MYNFVKGHNFTLRETVNNPLWHTAHESIELALQSSDEDILSEAKVAFEKLHNLELSQEEIKHWAESIDDYVPYIKEAVEDKASNLGKEEDLRIKSEVNSLGKDDAHKEFSKLRAKIEFPNAKVGTDYTTEEGLRYHFLKSRIKYFDAKINPETGKRIPGRDAAAITGQPTVTILTRSDGSVATSANPYTPLKEIPQKLVYSQGNKKLGTDTIIFNMGSATDCPSLKLGMCQVCKDKNLCYAFKAERQYVGDERNIKRARDVQHQQWKTFSVEKMIQEIIELAKKHKGVRYLRVNESGDFYGAEDVKKISDIAEGVKGVVKVYMYTARKDLAESGVFEGLSSNLTINGSGFMVHNAFIALDHDEFNKNITEKSIQCRGDCRVCQLCKWTRGINIPIRVH